MSDDLDFSGYRQHSVDAGQVRKFTLSMQFRYTGEDGTEQLSPAPVLHVLPATEDSRAFANAQQRGVRRNVKAKHINADVLDQIRDDDRTLYAKHLVRGWDDGTVVNARGKVVPFSEAAAKALLLATPNHIFDELRVFCSDATNFTTIDAESIAKK